jgi:tRNA threonylcarbamoyladenosine biosynthesis protein TsaE
MEFLTNSPEETEALGAALGRVLRPGTVIAYSGDLGAGKTTFVRGLAKGLHIEETIQSPTFNIMKIYLKGDRPLIHIDAYRLADVDTDIGLDEYIGYESGITVIEWPNFIEKLIPENAILFEIFHKNENERLIRITTDNESLLGGL